MRERPADVRLKQHNHGEDDVANEIANQPVHRLEVPPSRPVKKRHQQAAAERHLHGARPPNQLEDLVDQDRHDEDVEDVPPADGRAPQEKREPGHGLGFRASWWRLISSATRTTCTISAIACTRMICAPANTAAVTAAA